jgi:hypothetical protein
MPEVNHLLIALIRIYFRQPNTISKNFLIRVFQDMFCNIKSSLEAVDRLEINTERNK